MILPVVAELIFSNREQVTPAIALLLLSVFLLWYSYRGSILPRGRKRLAMALKTGGFLLLAFCFLEPLWSSKTVKPGSNIFVQLADNSRGMQITDHGADQTRGEALQELLHPETPAAWQKSIEEDFQLRNYTFDSRLQRVEDFASLPFDGESSALAHSLGILQERFKTKPLAGILLFTDGNLTDLPSDPGWMKGLPPIFPIVMGSDAPLPDLGIQLVTVSETVFEDAPITLRSQIRLTRLEGQVVTAEVTNAEGELVERQTYRASKPDEIHSLRFRIKPDTLGISNYQLQLKASPSVSEAAMGNNQHAVTIDRGEGPYRILYVSGRPNWEYKFLRRSLADDEQVDLVGLIRMAKREPKFDFRGRTGETSNPLFRGFKDGSDEESEQYDQSVLIRMNTRDEQELMGGFPKTAEELFEFQGLIIDDLEAEFFSPDQMNLVERFVSFRGGGLLMLGGQESYHQGGYDKTPIGKLLPVYLDRLTERPDYQPVRLHLTREGLLQPWIRLRETEDAESKRLAEMPPFSVLNRLPAIKPGASVIAEVKDSQGRSYPAIAVQRYGAGQSAAITIGDLWRWGFEDEAQHEDMAKSWRQVLRWLVKDVPTEVEVAVDYEEGSNAPCRLEVRVRDEAYLAVDDALVICQITPPDGEVLELTALPVEDERGLYFCEYLPVKSGHYAVRAVVKNASGLEIGKDDAGWSMNRSAREFQSLVPNRALMSELAATTGGEVIAASDLKAFADGLTQREMPVMETWSRPAWHTPWLFLLALGCFVGEWGIRRKGGEA